MQTSEITVKGYLASLPPDKQHVITQLREFILKNLPYGYEEVMRHGCITYEIPLQVFPDTYNNEPLPILALAAEKNYCSLYLFCIYTSPALMQLLENGFQANNKKLDMGKSCLRFKTTNQLHLPTLAEIIRAVPPKEFIRHYQESRS